MSCLTDQGTQTAGVLREWWKSVCVRAYKNGHAQVTDEI